MTTEIIPPSALATRCHVWLFRHNLRSYIPCEHHLNLVKGRGCSKKTLLRYLKYGHRLSSEAFNALISTCEREFLPVLSEKHFQSATNEHKELLIERFGVKTMLEYGWKLPSRYIREFLVSDKVDFLEKYLSLIIFSEEDGRTLLSLKKAKLTKAFIESNPYLANTLFSLIAEHNDKDVFDTYFTHCKPLPAGRAEIISKLPPYVFAMMFASFSHEEQDLSFEEFKLLVDRDNLKMLEIYHTYRSIYQCEYIEYICANASDKFFMHCLQIGAFAYDSGFEYARMLKLPNRDLVLDYLTKHRIYDAEAEIKVLQTGDEEYINTYCKSINSDFQEETLVWIWLNGLGKKFDLTVTDLPVGYWQLETRIFTSGDEEMIEQYLFAGKAYSHGLTDFGEAQFFLHAPLDLIDAYLEENTPSLLAQKAIISRQKHNSALLSLYLYKHNNEFCFKAANEFLAQASTEQVLKYLKSLENLQNFLCCECPQVLNLLCGRGDKTLYRFLLDKHILLGNEDCALFIRHAPTEMVMELCENQDGFEEEAETELLRHSDTALVKYYLRKYKLSEQGEKVLIERFDPELVSLYFTDELSDYSQAQYYLR